MNFSLIETDSVNSSPCCQRIYGSTLNVLQKPLQRTSYLLAEQLTAWRVGRTSRRRRPRETDTSRECRFPVSDISSERRVFLFSLRPIHRSNSPRSGFLPRHSLQTR